MTLSTALSPAQCLGYVALVLGVSAFLQKNDRRLRFMNASQGMVYMVHFALLGLPTAAVISLVGATRTFLSIKTRSPRVAVVMLVLGAGLGIHMAHDFFSYLPVLATSIATPAIFFMRGIRMRLALLVCTLLWLVHNLHGGSKGGIIQECFIATANSFTIARLLLARRAAALNPAAPEAEAREREVTAGASV